MPVFRPFDWLTHPSSRRGTARGTSADGAVRMPLDSIPRLALTPRSPSDGCAGDPRGTARTPAGASALAIPRLVSGPTSRGARAGAGKRLLPISPADIVTDRVASGGRR